MKTLTEAQRRALTTLKAVRDANAAGVLARNPGAVPTEYVTLYELKRSFGITAAQLDALVRAGHLERSAGDGSGPMYRVASMRPKSDH